MFSGVAGLQVLRFDPKKVNAHERVRTFYEGLVRVEMQEKREELKEKNRKRMSGMGAEEYERKFVEDEE